jgi:hypothetical protein
LSRKTIEEPARQIPLYGESPSSAAGWRESRPQSPPRRSGNTIPREIAVEKLRQVLKQQGAFIGRDQAVPEGA